MIQQPDGSCNIASDTQRLKKYSEKNHSFLPTHMKNTLVVQNTVLPTTMTRVASFLFVDHVILLLDKKRYYEKSMYCFKYQHADCLFGYFKFRFNGQIAVKSGQVFDIV